MLRTVRFKRRYNWERFGFGFLLANGGAAIRITVLDHNSLKFNKNGRKILSSSIDRKSNSGFKKNGENVYQKSDGLQN